jgi:hypothetical protein
MTRRAALPPRHYTLLQNLQAAPSRAATLVAPLPAEAQGWSPAPGEWSAPQVITHLAAADAYFQARLERLVQADNPRLVYFGPAEAAPDETARLADALVRFATTRQTLLDFLTALPPASWARPGVHAVTGATTLAQQVQVIADHDREHFGQLSALRAAWESRPPS